jgi:MinD-like ATPase involved in chromosome partitioning or flagellar assembly
MFYTESGLSERIMAEVLAFVGACGGAGTTRLCVELGAALARGGRSVTILDAALTTQGLARYAPGRLAPDLSAVLTDEGDLADARVEVWPALPATAALVPTHAPFERLARAKREEAARRLESVIEQVETDAVIIDVPPLADNPAIAAVTAARSRLVVAPDSPRGSDLLPQIRGRLVDVGSAADGVVATMVDGQTPEHLADATATIPTGDPDVTKPAAVADATPMAVAVSALASECFGWDVTIEPADEGVLERHLP